MIPLMFPEVPQSSLGILRVPRNPQGFPVTPWPVQDLEVVVVVAVVVEVSSRSFNLEPLRALHLDHIVNSPEENSKG